MQNELFDETSKPGSITLARQIECVRREIAVRRSVYPKLIDRGQMTPEQAKAEVAVMEQVERTLLSLIDDRK